ARLKIGRETRELRARCRQVRTRTESSDNSIEDVDARRRCVVDAIGLIRSRLRVVAPAEAGLEDHPQTRLRDADDRRPQAEDLDGLPDDRRITAELSLPEPVADDGDLRRQPRGIEWQRLAIRPVRWRRRSRTVRLDEVAPEGDARAKHREEVRRHA